MERYGMLVWTDEPFTLKSGVPSNIYFHGREDVTDNRQLMVKCGQKLGQILGEQIGTSAKQPILIGVPTAANGFAASITHWRRNAFGVPEAGFRVMREVQKEHGATGHKGHWVNGRPDIAAHDYATIENVVTSGGSLRQAIERIGEDGYPVQNMSHLVFMDRQQGGVRKLREEGYNIVTIYKLLDVVWAFTELVLKGWDTDRLAAVEAEIAAHQVA